jgi:hypothetical protein
VNSPDAEERDITAYEESDAEQRQALIRAGGARDRNGEARAAVSGRIKQIGSRAEYVAFGRVRSGKATGISVEAT